MWSRSHHNSRSHLDVVQEMMSITMATLQTTVDAQQAKIESLEAAGKEALAAQGGEGAGSQAVNDLTADLKLVREMALGLESEKAGNDALTDLVTPRILPTTLPYCGLISLLLLLAR
jgi:hypothetical protein